MRYVTAEYLKEGMTLAKPFLGRNGEILLKTGVALTVSFIKRITEIGHAGLYIQDAFSEDLEIKDVISDELRRNVTKEVGRLMVGVGSGQSADFQSRLRLLSELLDQIINDIMSAENPIINIIDLKDYDLYTYQHSVNLCVLSCVVGTALGLTRNQLYDLALAAILHDVGKMFLDIDILNKPGSLSKEEFDHIKMHTILGYECVKKNAYLPAAVTVAIFQHHEKHNGEGYPGGVSGDAIHMNAQIISVIDVYDALTSKRPYRDPILPSEAYEYISGNSGQSFNPAVVEVFLKKVAPFPLGIHVQLSNGQTGLVFKNYGDMLTRPMIKLDPQPGQAQDTFLDLRNDPKALSITIQKVLLGT
jgi:HD-GYP domain-containing protein (c-di-GMP phosphodiesterase class II)